MTSLIDKISSGDTSRETADEVLLRFGWTLEEDGPLVDNPERWFVSPTGDEFLDGDQPNPLTSLDAAMALVPEGWNYSVIISDDGTCTVEGWNGKFAPDNVEIVCGALTEASARTLFALKAQEARNND